MMLATFLGIFFGFFFGNYLSFLKSSIDTYIMILKITILPYLMTSIIYGIGELQLLQAKQMLKKGSIFLLVIWSLNLSMIYLLYAIFPTETTGASANYIAASSHPLNFSSLLIPENIFYALTNNLVPPVVIFSLLVGVSFMFIKEKATTMSFMKTFVESLSLLTSWISKITPYGTFMIIAYQVGTVELSTIKQVVTYVILYTIGSLLLTFWIFPRLVSIFTNISTIRWIKSCLPILLLAYTTNVVIVCLPFIMDTIYQHVKTMIKEEEHVKHQIQGTVSIIFNIPLGSLFLILFILFSSTFYQIPLHLFDHLKIFATIILTGLGSVGLGSTINSLSFISESLALPQDNINLFLTITPFTAGFQSMLSTMQITTISLFMTFASYKLIQFKWSRCLLKLILTIIPPILICSLIKIFDPFPPIKNTNKNIYQIEVPTSSNPIIYHHRDEVPLRLIDEKEDALDRIRRTSVLRVGYCKEIPPFCFYNQHNQLVGYDMILAREMAKDLKCDLEFVPLDLKYMPEDLTKGYYDIIMSGLNVTEDRLLNMTFSQHYMSSQYVFLTKNQKKKYINDLAIIDQNREIKIWALKDSCFDIFAHILFKNNQIVLIDVYEDFSRLAGPNDILLWSKTQATAWLTNHSGLYMMNLEPPFGDILFSYAVAPHSNKFIEFINRWLDLKKSTGFIQQQSKIWIEGKVNIIAPSEERWSIISDILKK